MTDLDGALLEQWFAAARVGLALLDSGGAVVRENDELARLAAGEPADAVVLRHPDQPLRGVAVSVLAVDGHLALSAVPVSDEQVLQATLALALEGSGTGSFVWQVDADAIHWSPNLGPLHGLERGAAPTRYAEWLAGLHEDDRAWVDATITEALAGRDGYDVEFRVRDDAGETRWLHTRAHVLRHRDGRPRSVAGLTTDVTDRKRREVAAELLARVGLLLAESLDAQPPLQRIAELAVPGLADRCTIHVVGDDGRPAVAADAGAVVAIAADPEPAADLAAAVTTSGSTTLDDDATTLVVPIVARDGTLGAIALSHAAGRPYDTQDVELAEELGRRIGLALESAALHRAEREANRRLRDLQSVTDVALTHLELDALLRELLDRLAGVLDADVAKVLLPDEAGRALRIRAARGLAPHVVRELRVPVGAGAAGRIAAAGRPLILEDTGEADIVLDALREPGRSLAGVPLVLAGETIGVLVVSSRTRAYEDADLRLLELVADRLARAIRQGELYEQARGAALALQRSLLPEALPTIDGVDVSAQYLPGQDGTEVGGDWYDLFVLPDGRLAIVVGDVVGRGLRAATRMGRVRAGLRAYAFESHSPAEAIERMDRLVATEEPLEFTTLLAVYLDPETGAAQACSAGHLPPVLVDADGRASWTSRPGRRSASRRGAARSRGCGWRARRCCSPTPTGSSRTAPAAWTPGWPSCWPSRARAAARASSSTGSSTGSCAVAPATTTWRSSPSAASGPGWRARSPPSRGRWPSRAVRSPGSRASRACPSSCCARSRWRSARPARTSSCTPTRAPIAGRCTSPPTTTATGSRSR